MIGRTGIAKKTKKNVHFRHMTIPMTSRLSQLFQTTQLDRHLMSSFRRTASGDDYPMRAGVILCVPIGRHRVICPTYDTSALSPWTSRPTMKDCVSVAVRDGHGTAAMYWA